MSKKKNITSKGYGIRTIALFIVVCLLAGYVTFVGVGKYHRGKVNNIELGLDLAGGVSITYEIQEKNPSSSEISDTIYKLQKRVEDYSSEAEVYQEGDKRIVVEIPGVTNANEILEALGKPGNLQFLTEDQTVVLTGSNIKSAEATQKEDNGIKNYMVALSMDDEGAKKFAEATKNNIGKPIYILYDNEIVSYPTVQSAIENGECVIENMENMDKAEELASTIRIGALPLELKEMRSTVVGAKLGKDAIRTSLIAGGIGIAAVCIFMMVVYVVPGFCASIALLLYVLLTLTAINGFNVTLTLPGIAGVLLSIGMAVDANVIIFTRIKEEIEAGNSVQTAISEGFSKAMSAIVDGNVTTLIAAVVLLVKGSGTVIGFAQTLGLGILLSMFTALVVTKGLVNAAYALGAQDPKYYGKIMKFKPMNFVHISKFCAIASICVIGLGFVFMGINKSNPNIGNVLNYSLEFQGGTSITLDFPDDEKITDDVTSKVVDIISENANTTSVQTQKVESGNQLIIKTVELTVDQREAVEGAIKKECNLESYSTENISSSVSSEMKSDALVAVAIAIVCMLIYIAIRFKDFKFGFGSIIALAHDILVVLAVYAVAKLSVGNTFIACMLTILGYSINATIVVYDRIRENMKNPSIVSKGLKEVVNVSVGQTLSRSVNTSITTFVMIFILYILGVPSIKEFSLSLIAGVISGAYSSVFLAAPIWYFLKTKVGKKSAAVRENEARIEAKNAKKQK